MTILYPSNSSGVFKRSKTVQLGIKGTVISPALNYVKKHRVAAAQSMGQYSKETDVLLTYTGCLVVLNLQGLHLFENENAGFLIAQPWYQQN